MRHHAVQTEAKGGKRQAPTDTDAPHLGVAVSNVHTRLLVQSKPHLSEQCASRDALSCASSVMAAPHDDSDYGDELLAAIGFVDGFQFALLPPSPALHDATIDAVPGGSCGGDRAAQEERGDALVPVQQQHFDRDVAPGPQYQYSSSVYLLSAEGSLSNEWQGKLQPQNPQQQLLTDTTTTQTRRPQKRKPSWNPNKARNERKGEIVYLRKQVAELEAQLAEIQAKTPAANSKGTASIVARRPHTHAASADVALTTTTTVTCQSQAHAVKARAWEEIAKNQLEMRTKTERENIRLKLVLENQLKVAKNLGGHVNRAASTHEIQRCFPANQVRLMYPPMRDDDSEATAIVDSLVAGLEQSYAEVDAVFEANGLADSETAHINTQMHANSGSATHSLLLEAFATKVLPFDFAASVKAVWDHFVLEKEQISSRVSFNNSNEAPNEPLSSTSSIIKNFHLKLQAKGTTANFGVKQVIRRYDEQERVVIVWRSFFDPIESSCDEPLTGVRFLEKGYVVVKKPATICGNVTLLQPCFVITPIFSSQQVEEKGNRYRHHQPPPTGAMADFVLATTVANIRTSHQMIEDALLQQAMMAAG